MKKQIKQQNISKVRLPIVRVFIQIAMIRKVSVKELKSTRLCVRKFTTLTTTLFLILEDLQ